MIQKTTGNKRSRISKTDKEEARQNIHKKIRLDVVNEFDVRYLQNNCQSSQFREAISNQVLTPDLIEELSNARLLLQTKFFYFYIFYYYSCNNFNKLYFWLCILLF